MTLRFEMFAAGPVKPEDLWAVVGDPRRLSEWTDAERVEHAPEPPLTTGTAFATVDGRRRLEWRLITVEQRLIEAVSQTPIGQVAVGARVVREPGGARLILAAAIDPAGSRLRARLLHMPALRGRMDRWVHRALGVATSDPAGR
jgi:hypothetical protein